jgi:hypothetical protein
MHNAAQKAPDLLCNRRKKTLRKSPNTTAPASKVPRKRRSDASPSRRKKSLELGGAFVGHYTALNLDPMIQGRVLRDVENRTRCTGAWIARGKHQTLHSCMHHCACAHRAGLERYIQRGIEQTVVTQRLGCGAHGDHFSVSRGVVRADRSIPPFSDDHAVFDDDRADGNLTCPFGVARQLERALHERDVVRHARYSHSIVAGGLPEMS